MICNLRINLLKKKRISEKSENYIAFSGVKKAIKIILPH